MENHRRQTWQKVLSLFIICLFLTFQPQKGLTQETVGGSGVFGDSVSDLYTVAGVGVAGSVLGLSTLSFVEEPGENLRNIITGGAIGIILGVGVVAWKHASRSKDMYDSTRMKDSTHPKRKDFFEGSELFAKSNIKKRFGFKSPMVRYHFHF